MTSYTHPTLSDTGFDPRTNVVFAIDRLKEKAPNPISANDLISYVLPAHKRGDSIAIDRFKQFLSVNPKVTYNSKVDSFSFKPTLSIYNASDLLAYLQKQETASGVSVRDLKDGWPDVEETIDRLEKQGRLSVNRQKKDNHPRMVWANDPSLIKPLDQEFKDSWERFILPLGEDVIKELKREKLKSTGEVAAPKAAGPTVKKTKKIRRGARITNVHMQDQFRDYSQQRPQAQK